VFIFFEKKFKFTQAIHICLIFFYVNSLHQVYDFNQNSIFLKYQELVLFKVTNLDQVQLTDYSYDTTRSTPKSSFARVLLNNKYQAGNSFEPSFSDIFEKNIFISSNKIEELYNYNLQLLIEASNVGIFCTLYLILILLSIF
jgi:hypothetical protein